MLGGLVAVVAMVPTTGALPTDAISPGASTPGVMPSGANARRESTAVHPLRPTFWPRSPFRRHFMSWPRFISWRRFMSGRASVRAAFHVLAATYRRWWCAGAPGGRRRSRSPPAPPGSAREPVLRAGHPGDGLLHQRAAQVVGAAAAASPPCPRRRASPRSTGCWRSGRAAGAGPSRARPGCRARSGPAGRCRRGRSGALVCTNGSATNSVKPPVRSWMPASTRKWPSQWPGWSTWPYIIVELDRMPSSCAVVTTSTQVDGRQLALGQHPAHLVVEDLRGGAGDGVQARPRAARSASPGSARRPWPRR